MRAVCTKMPKKDGEDNIRTFINWCKRMKVPLVIYTYFETILKKIDDRNQTNTKRLNEYVVCVRAR